MWQDIAQKLIVFTNTKMRCNVNPPRPAYWVPVRRENEVDGPMVSGDCLREPCLGYVICQTNLTIYERGMSL